MTTTSADLLSTIVAAARRSVFVREQRLSRVSLEAQIERRPRGDLFENALRTGTEPRIIAECKRRSPSRGILREDYRPGEHAVAYERAGAAAISVLTEPTFFDGDLDHLRQVRAAVAIPVLRKDFIVTEYQIVEAAALGADAVLLIVAVLADIDLRRLMATAAALGLAALVEVHDADELARAADAGAHIIGVNSRNLRTLSVDRGVLDRLAPSLPRDAVAVAESGLKSAADVRLSRDSGYHAVLVGEYLISQPDPGKALRDLRAA